MGLFLHFIMMEVKLLFLESYSQASYFTRKLLYALKYVSYPNNYSEEWFEGKKFNEYFFSIFTIFCHYLIIVFNL